ncbi:MAG: M23 family metallopeptidase [Desulfovibrionaceae bacterium]|jgi:murein DD-endopeptidase MepM/ murein hydrolase activator NlpD|nr:M23 family metallopeptidase [Desulfovibrionaceae bacterium]
MLFRKYDVVVFKDNEGACRKTCFRGWHVVAIAAVILGLVAGNAHFVRYYLDYMNVQGQLQAAQKTVEEQNNQLLSLANKLRTVDKDLVRIRDFDSKLRVMINLDQDQVDTVTPVGGPETKDFSDSYLPIYRQELLARKMHNFVNQLSTDVRLEEVRQQELMRAIRENQDILASTPSIWPTEGWISSRFGYRMSPFTGRREFHKGIDISGRTGTPIYAPAKGVVTFTGVDGGYGKCVVISHGSGIITRYAHLHKYTVKKGQIVSRGELVGRMGSTGRSTGPHLHYEVRLNGVCVNPMRYILN